MRIVSLPRLILLLALLALLPACSFFKSKRTAPETETLPVAQLYQKARQYMADGDYDNAEHYFKRLTARFPFGPYSEQAELDLAYVQYKGNKPDDAYSAINRFIKTYPAQKHIDYAYYLRGLINFNRTVGLLDRFVKTDSSQRDTGYTQQSFTGFTQLLQRYPNSRYAADARQRVVYLRNHMAQHELNIALFYLRKQAYVGASLRGKYIIEHYQTSPQTGDALAIMAKSYSKLGKDKLAADARKVLQINYPSHPYLSNPDKWPDFPSLWHRMIPFSSHG